MSEMGECWNKTATFMITMNYFQEQIKCMSFRSVNVKSLQMSTIRTLSYWGSVHG